MSTSTTSSWTRCNYRAGSVPAFTSIVFFERTVDTINRADRRQFPLIEASDCTVVQLPLIFVITVGRQSRMVEFERYFAVHPPKTVTRASPRAAESPRESRGRLREPPPSNSPTPHSRRILHCPHHSWFPWRPRTRPCRTRTISATSPTPITDGLIIGHRSKIRQWLPMLEDPHPVLSTSNAIFCR